VATTINRIAWTPANVTVAFSATEIFLGLAATMKDDTR
jgi:hypothetical protein